MAQVDFYVLGEPGDDSMLRVACRLTEKAWQQGMSVFVLADDERMAERMDDALWTFRQEGFVPHERWTGTGAPGAPVLIACDTDAPALPDVLVNLGATPPDWHGQCQRVAEVVGGDPERKASGRKRYREYRDAGFELRTHEV